MLYPRPGSAAAAEADADKNENETEADTAAANTTDTNQSSSSSSSSASSSSSSASSASKDLNKTRAKLAQSIASSHFSPEFVNRLDELICFAPLDSTAIASITGIQLAKVVALLKDKEVELK